MYSTVIRKYHQPMTYHTSKNWANINNSTA
nr:MAG TPA: hypothetical protein [Bacteriophage sp.]